MRNLRSHHPLILLASATAIALLVSCGGPTSTDARWLRLLENQPVVAEAPSGFTRGHINADMGKPDFTGERKGSDVTAVFTTDLVGLQTETWMQHFRVAGWTIQTADCESGFTATKDLEEFVAYARVSLLEGSATVYLAAPASGTTAVFSPTDRPLEEC